MAIALPLDIDITKDGRPLKQKEGADAHLDLAFYLDQLGEGEILIMRLEEMGQMQNIKVPDRFHHIEICGSLQNNFLKIIEPQVFWAHKAP